MKQLFLRCLLCIFLMTLGIKLWATTVTYHVSSSTSVSTTGTAPNGSIAVYAQDHSTAGTMNSSSPNIHLTLSGFVGCVIKGVSVNIKSSNGKTAAISIYNGTDLVHSSSPSISTEYGNKALTITSFTVNPDNDINITFTANGNSVYLDYIRITYVQYPIYSVNLSRNGNVQQLKLCYPYLLPDIGNEDAIGNWLFKGWSSNSIDSPVTILPDTILSVNADSQTVYAVYGQTNASSGITYDVVSSLSGIKNGKYYIAVGLINANNFNFANASADSGHAGVESTGVAKADSYLPSQIPSGAVLYEINGDNVGGFSIKELSTNKYLIATSNKASLSYNSSCSERWIFSERGGSENGFVLTGNKGSKLSCNSTSATTAIRNYESTGSFYSPLFFFREIEHGTFASNLIHISSVGYSTYYNSTQAYIMPESMTGYIWNNGLQAMYQENSIVPANVALVVKANQGDYAIKYTIGGTAPDHNSLLGTDTSTPLLADENYYFYGLSLDASNDLNSVGFYWMTADGAAFTNGAHKAYLKLPKSISPVKAFTFDDLEDGIMEVHCSENDNTGRVIFSQSNAYNLLGQRINSVQKGLYIVNGRKVLGK